MGRDCRFLFSILSLLLIPFFTGCEFWDPDSGEKKCYVIVDGPVGDLYRLYFESGNDPDQFEYELLLYLDSSNGPNPNYSYPYLSLKNSLSAGGLWDRVGYDYYEYDDIPPDSGFPEELAPGWKVQVSGASVSVCQTCIVEGCSLKLITLYGNRDRVEFVWDPADTLATYVRAVPILE